MMTTTSPSPTTTGGPRPTSHHLAGHAAVLFTGAIFGIFYAWVSTTMWGLDAGDPRVAIEAMQNMNAEIRNAAFFPVFFLTPAVAALAAFLAQRAGARPAAALFGAAAVVYLVGGIVVTATINVPMNEELARVAVPADATEAQRIWDEYSGRWQIWNTIRTVASGAALLLSSLGVAALSSSTRTPR